MRPRGKKARSSSRTHVTCPRNDDDDDDDHDDDDDGDDGDDGDGDDEEVDRLPYPRDPR